MSQRSNISKSPSIYITARNKTTSLSQEKRSYELNYRNILSSKKRKGVTSSLNHVIVTHHFIIVLHGYQVSAMRIRLYNVQANIKEYITLLVQILLVLM